MNNAIIYEFRDMEIVYHSNQDIKIIQGDNEVIISFGELEEIMDVANREYNYKPDVIDYLSENYDYNAMVEDDTKLIYDFLNEYASLRKTNDGGNNCNCLSWTEYLNEVRKSLKYRLERYSFELPQYKAVDIIWKDDYLNKDIWLKEIIIPRAFANNKYLNEDDIEEYINEYTKYLIQGEVGLDLCITECNSYSLVPTQLIAENIKWDIDDEENLLSLPTTIEIPDDFEGGEDEISDYITNKYGFCHRGYDLKAV